ncbi:DNA mismatch repair protein MutS [Candidatus Nitronereus thalassa]|uniref:DNA mismatch repair protein MutS n=1 Tax=Candidatus Nitronereus thalassa TaxID=3020898 RepID=A0ABU3K7E9_9BACT|nr:DNA mismatch repair protein MutS [Candidatus Nitronereus thalassa]MDT7042303.1 DNA mismatch repair protein MutS [Candidatus Nitronereus thalassa]
MSTSDLTPLMRQYKEVKEAYRDAIVFFRVGDFYEMFFEDAKEASSILNITLTSRDKNSPNPVPLCGIPHHASSNYVSKLLKSGKTVALCEQVEDPKFAKGLVKREVVRLYTPGTLFDAELLDSKESNFLSAVSWTTQINKEEFFRCGMAAADLSTGEFILAEFFGPHAQDDLLDELLRTGPQELILPDNSSQGHPSLQRLLAAISTLRIPCVQDDNPGDSHMDAAHRLLLDQFEVAGLENLNLDPSMVSVQAAVMILKYLHRTQPLLRHGHLQRPQVRHTTQEMHVDAMTLRNLEILFPLNPEQKNATLLSVLDHTVTAMGSRLLRHWLVRPLLNVRAINERLDAVAEMVKEIKGRMELRETLKGIPDLERISSRIALETGTPRDLLNLREALSSIPTVRQRLIPFQSPLIKGLLQGWDDLQDLAMFIQRAISPEAPINAKEGGIIQDGYNEEVDDLRRITREGSRWITDLEQQERHTTGIDSLKVKYNQVFGYYFEVTKPNLSRVPGHFIRKQTMANAERFTSDKLRSLEEKITGASLTLRDLENELFQAVRQKVGQETLRVQGMAKRFGILDLILTFSEISAKYRYSRPELHEGGGIHIKEGRHPVIEKLLASEGFIANDTCLDLDENRLLLITGPNMAGKSTFLRQTGLIVLLAHIGCFVPASEAKIGLVDRIFTRVGASDNLAGGQSTFMVEMSETARILGASTSKSLILLDEIGRGTSTYDGLSLAWSIAEYIQDRNHLGARTLFATHYHEMTELENHRSGIKNYTIAVKELEDNIVFLRKIIPGKADRSYGIHVAQMAGIPKQVISRAEEVLSQLEQSESSQKTDSEQTPNDRNDLPTPHPILEEVKQMDLFTMTPLEAMNRLAELKKQIG